MLFADAPPTEGPLLADRYRLISRIGEGGMAGVYRAWDERLRVWRAAKVLLPEFARKKKLRVRFEREAHTMARLEHRNLVRVVDVGNRGQLPFIVMELVPCGTLMQWLERNGPMPPRLAVSAVLQICEGLSEVHRNQVVHRDIKPHNVLISEHAVLKLTDFGIAQQADEELTRAGSVMGTMGYMAPEQRTDASSVDHRADLYGVGATLWKLLTDKPVRDLFMYGEDPSILDGLDEGLAEILMACLAYHRDQRPESVEELTDALAAVLAELPDDPEGTPPLPLDGVIERGEERAAAFDEIAPAFTLSDASDEGPRSFGGSSAPSSDLVAPQKLAGLPYGLPRKMESPADAWVSYEDGPVRDDDDDDSSFGAEPSLRAEAHLDDAGPDSLGSQGTTESIDDDYSAPSSLASLYVEEPPAPPPPAPVAPPVAAPPEPGLDVAFIIRGAVAGLLLFFVVFGGGMFWSRSVVVAAAEASFSADERFYQAMDQERNVVTELVGLDRNAQVLEGMFLDYLDHPREPERWERAQKFMTEFAHYAKAADRQDGASARETQQRVARLTAAYLAAEQARAEHAAAATGFPGTFAATIGLAPAP